MLMQVSIFVIDERLALCPFVIIEELVLYTDVWDWSMLVRANFVITTSVVVRRDLLFAVGPFNNKTLGAMCVCSCVCICICVCV